VAALVPEFMFQTLAAICWISECV